MKCLKIAVVLGQFPTVSETFIVNQIGFLKEVGHHIDIFCLGKKNKKQTTNVIINKYNLVDNAVVFKWRDIMPLNKIERIIKVIIILIKSFGTVAFIKLIESFNFIKYGFNAINLNQFFKNYHKEYFLINRYDVIHIHFADNAVKLSNQLESLRNKIIITFHGYDAHNFEPSFFQKILTLNHIHYTVNTNFTKNKVLQLGFTNSNITVLPMGIDTSFFRPQNKTHITFNILFVGRLIEFKAPLLAIKIMQQLLLNKVCDVHLNIVGSGNQYELCKEYIKLNKLNSFITLHNNKSQQEIKDIMNVSDIFLYPGIIDKKGRCENQGLVIQEAQAMELPVLISYVGGMHEGMLDKQTGYVIKSQDIEAFANAIVYLINHPEKCKQMGEAGRKFVVKKYDSKVLGAQLLKIYQS